MITLAGGCFWCLQPIFQDLRGVEKVEVGYSGGRTRNPTYEDVCTDSTGHAEALEVTYYWRLLRRPSEPLAAYLHFRGDGARNRFGVIVSLRFTSWHPARRAGGCGPPGRR